MSPDKWAQLSVFINNKARKAKLPTQFDTEETPPKNDLRKGLSFFND